MIKLIFLDIDGVIATPDYVKEGLWALNPEKQKLLGEILKATDAKIVLSSSWRKLTLEDTKEHMTEEGFEFVDNIIGVTIRAYHYIKKIENEKGIHLSIPRGVEIKQWIDTNIHSENGKNYQHKKLGIDYTYVILDDDSDMLLEQKNNFINTHFEIGLTGIDVVKAIKILNNEN
jgi:hypothetical protein